MMKAESEAFRCDENAAAMVQEQLISDAAALMRRLSIRGLEAAEAGRNLSEAADNLALLMAFLDLKDRMLGDAKKEVFEK